MKKILVFLLMLISIFSFSAEAKTKDIPFNSFISLKGINPEYNHSFFIQKDWDVKDVELKLKFAQTQIRHYKNSTMTIFVNDTPVDSIELYPLQNNYEYDLKINKELLKYGFNNVRIKLFHRITDEECTLDEINTANWVVLDKESLVSVQYEDKIQDISLVNYPFPFVTENGNLQVVIALPDKPDTSEIAAATTIASFLGRKAKFYNQPVKIIKESEINEEENVILISKSERLTNTLVAITPEEQASLDKNKGVVKETNIGNKKLLLITGKTDEALKNSTKALVKDNLYFQLKPDSNIVGDIQDIGSKNIKLSSLQDFGYDNVLLKGRGQKVISYNLELGKNINYNNLKMKINFKTSNNIDFSKSEVTAYVNGIPVSSKKIVSINSNNNTLEFFVPPRLLVNGTVNLRIEFYVMSNIIGCDDSLDDSTWVLVTNDSDLQVAGTRKVDYDLGAYPGPFIENYQLSNFGFVIPNDLDVEELTYLINTAFYLGKNTLETNYIDVYNEMVDNKNLIVYGTSKEKYIKDINNKLFLKYNNDFMNFENNKEISFLQDNGGSFGSLQIIKDNKRYLMIATGAKKTEAATSLSYLTKSSATLQGRALLISEFGQTANLGNVESETAVSGARANSRTIAVAISFILALLMGVIAVFMNKKGENK